MYEHIVIHFFAKRPRVSHVNNKCDRGYEREIQSILNNIKH